MEKSDIDEILIKHTKWLNGDVDGKRADLRGANLQEANLRGANLRGANLYRADFQGADLRGADLDFSCLHLCCGSFRAIVDDDMDEILEDENESKWYGDE